MDSTECADVATKAQGRGVLEGAFSVLEALSDAPDGLGLSELSRECGLPKATTFRLVEQLAGIGAVQRHERRYFVGSLLVRLGRSWQPFPRLRRVALQPVKALAASSRTAVAITVLDGDRIRVVTATLGAVGELPSMQPDSYVASRTAAGRVLLATQPDRDPPAAFSGVEWRRLRAGLRTHGAVVIDHQEATPGICCVAAPVRLPEGSGTASISALVVNRTVPPNLVDSVLRTADKISLGFTAR
jgi:IclR family transcriptional regulator, acetate operon repressor